MNLLFESKSGIVIAAQEVLAVGPVINEPCGFRKVEVFYKIIFKGGSALYVGFGIHKINGSQSVTLDAENDRAQLITEMQMY